MKALSVRQRAQVNAALAILHKQGHDVPRLQQQVRTITATGRDAAYAYERVIGAHLSAHPGDAPVVERMVALVKASDAATVGRYDAALTRYIATGDEAHVNNLAGTVRADSVALAVRNGEIDRADADAGRVDWQGMGLAAPERFAFEGVPAATPVAPQAPSPAPAPVASAWQAPASPFCNQVSYTGSPGGVRSASATARMNREAMPTIGGPSPYAGMAPAAIRAAMAADAAAPRGYIPADGEGI